MELGTLVIVIIAVFLLILLLNFLKQVAKTVFVGLLIILILVGITGFFVAKDLNDFGKGMVEEQNLFILRNNQTFVTSFVYKNQELKSFFDTETLNEYNELYLQKKYDEIINDNHKLFIIDISGIDVNETDQEIYNFLLDETKLPSTFDPNDDLTETKAYGFLYLIVKDINSNPKFILTMYKNGYIEVFPETITFKLLGIISNKLG
jgi:hypothetical protein